VVWKILHEGVRFIEQGREPDPQAKRKRAQMLARALRKLGYEVAITPIKLATAEHAMPMSERIFEGV
jgi:tRNA(Ile)-lysidine synthase TilS/MesJ